jgi:RNA-splicing ligase RtcB
MVAVTAVRDRIDSAAAELDEVSEGIWEIPASAWSDMRVPARLFADRELLEGIWGDQSLATGSFLPDRQLACAPLSSPEGEAYLAAMSCAANFAWANRQTMAHRVREAVAAAIDRRAADGTRQVYDVAHNVAKLETDGGRTLCVHLEGGDAGVPGGLGGDPGLLPRRRPAGLHSGEHGDG